MSDRAVVVGAGHNGLVAACYLAKAGMDVEVVERDTVVGGAVSTVERFPGYRMDRGSSAHIMVRHTRIVEDLELERFGLEYTGADNARHRPIMLHRALLGSVERFFGVMLEHYAGNFPTWLSPVQVRVLPVATAHEEYAEKVGTLYGDINSATFDANGISLRRVFKPIDIAIVVDNLFSNAGKAGARHMTFTCRRTSTGGAVEIVVADDGRGINEGSVDASKLFERGYSGSPRGSGLGLYHVMQVIEELGGSIGLDPERPKGAARFVIRLPREAKGT